MKKFLSLIITLTATITLFAQTTYTSTLYVAGLGDDTIVEENVPVILTQTSDTTYKIELKDFNIQGFNAGDITVPTLDATTNADGSIYMVSEPKGSENNIKVSGMAVRMLIGFKDGVQGKVEATLSGNSLSIKLPLSVAGYNLDITTTDINTTRRDDTTSATTYTINGTRAINTRGIIIRNGKKYVK